jgi:4-hydroxy-tetrahydrodipicolinate synthase
VKTAAYLMGIMDNLEFRLPLCPLMKANEEKMKTFLADKGLLKR